MDYRIFTNRSQFKATDLLEIGPGRYSGKHWQEGFIFIREDEFLIAEYVIIKHLPGYDHYGMNDIPKSKGESIVSDYKNISGCIARSEIDEALEVLGLDSEGKSYARQELHDNREKISPFFDSLAQSIEGFYKNEAWICVLGI